MPADPLFPLHQDLRAVPRKQARLRYRRLGSARVWLGTIRHWLSATRRWLVLGPDGETSIHDEDPRKEQT